MQYARGLIMEYHHYCVICIPTTLSKYMFYHFLYRGQGRPEFLGAFIDVYLPYLIIGSKVVVTPLL